MRGDGPLPKTSQPPVGKFVELFESLKGTYDAVISIHLSSGISGTYAGAVQAGEMVEGIETHVFDSELSCYVQGFYVIRAAEMAQQGATPDQIIAELIEMNQTMRAYFMVDDLSHLQRGGQIIRHASVHRRTASSQTDSPFPRKSDCPIRKDPDTQKSDETHCGHAGGRRCPNAA